MLLLLRRCVTGQSTRLQCVTAAWGPSLTPLYTLSKSLSCHLSKPGHRLQQRCVHMSAEKSFYQVEMDTQVTHPSELMDLHAREIFRTAVNSVLPREMIDREVRFIAGDSLLRIQNKEYHLKRNVHVVGFGKAVSGMARAVEDILGQHIVQGAISVPVGTQTSLEAADKHDLLLKPGSKIQMFEGAKDNLPDKEAMEAAKRIQTIVQGISKDDILLVLISGGGSALLPLPWPPITLEEEMVLTSLMARRGASILDLNAVRKHIEVLKGGGLAKMAGQAQVISLIMSDVIGDPLDMIASGPTVRDTSTVHHCLQILSRLGITDQVPQSIMDLFLRKKQSELVRYTPAEEPGYQHQSPSDQYQWSRVQNVVIGSNVLALHSASQRASELGYIPVVVSTTLSGEARDVGAMFARLAQFVLTLTDHKAMYSRPGELARIELRLLSDGLEKTRLNEVHSSADMAVNRGRGLCILAGGETTVQVRGTGKGGRNQEMALSAAMTMQKLLESWSNDTRRKVLFCSAGTDGQDGPTDAAGAVVSGDLATVAAGKGLDPQVYLDNNDSYTFFSNLLEGSRLLKSGLTSTNVMDVQVLLIQFS